MRSVLWAAAAAIVISGCASPYQPHAFAGGYTEQWRSKNLVVVDFKGNGFTSADQAADMALLRAAELALAHDYRAFRIVGDADIGSATFVPSTSTTTGRVNSDGEFVARTHDNSFTEIKPGSRIYVVMVALPDPTDPSLYEATAVVARLGPKYK